MSKKKGTRFAAKDWDKNISKPMLASIQKDTGVNVKKLDDLLTNYQSGSNEPNSGGKLSRAQFEEMWKKSMPGFESMAGVVFNAVDTDGDGQVNFQDVVYGVKMAMDEQVLDKMTWTLKLYEATGASQVAYSKVTAMARDAIKLAKGIETDKAELEQHTKTLMDVLSTYLTTAGASTSAQSYNLPTVISAVQTAANLYKTMGKNPV